MEFDEEEPPFDFAFTLIFVSHYACRIALTMDQSQT